VEAPTMAVAARRQARAAGQGGSGAAVGRDRRRRRLKGWAPARVRHSVRAAPTRRRSDKSARLLDVHRPPAATNWRPRPPVSLAASRRAAAALGARSSRRSRRSRSLPVSTCGAPAQYRLAGTLAPEFRPHQQIALGLASAQVRSSLGSTCLVEHLALRNLKQWRRRRSAGRGHR
jgi:hypothetical protein